MEIGNILFNRGIHRSTKFYPFSFRSLESSDEWKALLNCMGLDSYGCIQEDRYDLEETIAGGHRIILPSGSLEINPYYWGECTCGNENEQDKTCPLSLHNFQYQNLSKVYIINWYKYPFRDSYTNCKLSEDEWKNIWRECISLCKGA